MSEPIKQASFNMSFTGVFGGPCPTCGKGGELIRHVGEYGPGGRRFILHREGGVLHECMVPHENGTLFTVGGKWEYREGTPKWADTD